MCREEDSSKEERNRFLGRWSGVKSTGLIPRLLSVSPKSLLVCDTISTTTQLSAYELILEKIDQESQYVGEMNTTMQDPSSGVHQQLLPHLHLLLNVALPRPESTLRGLTVNKVIEYLLHSAQWAKSEKTVSWTMFDGPPAGSLFITWQPSSFGKRFASDGYIYADPEQGLTSQVRGYVGGHGAPS